MVSEDGHVGAEKPSLDPLELISILIVEVVDVIGYRSDYVCCGHYILIIWFNFTLNL
jgi:hypothetical protein